MYSCPLGEGVPYLWKYVLMISKGVCEGKGRTERNPSTILFHVFAMPTGPVCSLPVTTLILNVSFKEMSLLGKHTSSNMHSASKVHTKCHIYLPAHISYQQIKRIQSFQWDIKDGKLPAVVSAAPSEHQAGLAPEAVGPAPHRLLTEATGNGEQEAWSVRSSASQTNQLKTSDIVYVLGYNV